MVGRIKKKNPQVSAYSPLMKCIVLSIGTYYTLSCLFDHILTITITILTETVIHEVSFTVMEES